MDVPGQPLFRPDRPLDPWELRRVAEQAGRADAFSGDQTSFGPGGSQLLPQDVEPAFWARLTAKSDSPGTAPLYYYSWIEQTAQGDGTFADRTGGLSGAFDAAAMIEVNKNADVPTDAERGAGQGTVVRAWRGETYLDAGERPWFFSGGAGAGAGGGGCNLAGMQATDCLIAIGPQNAVTCHPDGLGQWVSEAGLNYFGGSAIGAVRFWFAGGTLHLSVGGTELLWCGNNCFTGGPLTGFTAAGDAGTSCQAQTFTVCVKCDCCPMDGWGGAGWYCVRAATDGTGTGTGTGTGSSEPCVVVELLDADKCDRAIEICSGPYASEAAAKLVCGTGGPTGGPWNGGDCSAADQNGSPWGCPAVTLSGRLLLTILSTTGGCSNMPSGTVPLCYNGLTGGYDSNGGTLGGATGHFHYLAGNLDTVGSSVGICSGPVTVVRCVPFLATFTLTCANVPDGPCSGTITGTIAEP